MDIGLLGHGNIIKGREIDATANRERVRRRRMWRMLAVLALPLGYVWYRELRGNPVEPGAPGWLTAYPEILISVVLMLLLASLILFPMLGAGRSPHVLLRPSDVKIRLDDVVGASTTKREAIDTLNLFLASDTFSREMGGNARRGVLFEGPPGTGKTYLAKAMAAEAGVPFLFVSATAFQSQYYGATARKLRSFFKALRKAARVEGGAIGFIEEFDAIGAARHGMGGEGFAGVVNELLVQMQSFDLPTGSVKLKGKLIDLLNAWLPNDRRLRRPKLPAANVLVVAATNRAADLDPALLRPGRFDRTIHFDLPPRSDRVEIAEYYLARKSHAADVDAAIVADMTGGYSPVRIERLLDEALIIALRHNRREMILSDVLEAQLITEVGLSHEMGYHPDERRRIAVHEAGHALVAVLSGRDVKVASILRRGGALGLVAHGDAEEKLLRTPSEAKGLIAVALAGRAAEQQEFGEASSGISSDLAAATSIAAQLVGLLGYGGTGLLSLEAAHIATAGNLVAKVLADQPSREKADAILAEGATTAAELIRRHRRELLAIADQLCALDELDGDAVRALVYPREAATLG
jgi:ATP-dependent Zn protease